jgi:adenosylcobinamide-GDP ribazoletransferase
VARRVAAVIGALAFLTVVGRARPPAPADLAWFPVVGALLGAALGLIWWGAAEAWPPGVAAALVVTGDLALTGMLHVDGLADSADGLLPHLARERRLEVMAEPGVGAFAVTAVALALLLRWAAITEMPVSGWRAVVTLATVWATSRSAMVLILATQPYARAEGLASAYSTVPPRARAVAVGAVLLAATAALPRPWGPLAIVAALAAAGSVVVLSRRRVGGYTGDVLGAAAVIAETAAVLVLAAGGS